eukprot:8198117-Pyramimonas_sp.AAC.1
MEHEAVVLRQQPAPATWHARVTATSPSSCAIRSSAVGAATMHRRGEREYSRRTTQPSEGRGNIPVVRPDRVRERE